MYRRELLKIGGVSVAGLFAAPLLPSSLFAADANYEIVSAEDLPLAFDALDDMPEGVAVKPYLRQVG